MPHAYELHADVSAPCLCCRAPRTFHFTSPTDQVVCADCARHLGSDKAERRDTEHVSMWARLHEGEREAHRRDAEAAEAAASTSAEAIAALTEKVAELTALVAGDVQRPVSDGVRELLQNDLLRRAERNGELAARRNDRLMAVLWRLCQLHRDDLGRAGSCGCGRPTVACTERAALEPLRHEVAEWESKNLALLAAGTRHALPADHPAVAAQAPSRSPGSGEIVKERPTRR